MRVRDDDKGILDISERNRRLIGLILAALLDLLIELGPERIPYSFIRRSAVLKEA